MNTAALSSALPTVAPRRSNERWIVLALLVPGVLALLVTFVFPILWLLRTSVDGAPGTNIPFSLDALHSLSDPFYWRVIGNTLQLGATVGLSSVLLSYPIALFLSRSTSRWRALLVAAAVAPLLTSAVVRTYGWMVILGDQGVVNSTLLGLGWITQPLRIANNTLGAVIALTEILMPYAILAMLSGFGRISTALEEAAAVLGASPWRVFLRVTLPLSAPGVATAFLLTFVLAISSFVTPQLVGGGRVFVLATEIYSEATITLNWPLAATLSLVVLGVFGALVGLYQWALARLAPWSVQ